MFSFVIVDYNSIRDTMNYIKHCSKQILEIDECHFIIVDNKPDSLTKEILSKEFHILLKMHKYEEFETYDFEYEKVSVSLIITNKNSGYAKGNNIGMGYAIEKYTDSYAIISNNDIFFEQTISLKTLKRILDENVKIAVVGPKVIDLNGNLQGPYQKSTAWNLLIKHPLEIIPGIIWGIKDKDQINKIFDDGVYYWVSGCFFMCDLHKMQEVDFFDEETFLYAEEMILAERLKRKGYLMFYTKQMQIIHQSSKTISNSFKNLEAEQTLFDSTYYYFKKYMQTNALLLYFAKVNFAIVKFTFKVGQYINRKFEIIKKR